MNDTVLTRDATASKNICWKKPFQTRLGDKEKSNGYCRRDNRSQLQWLTPCLDAFMDLLVNPQLPQILPAKFVWKTKFCFFIFWRKPKLKLIWVQTVSAIWTEFYLEFDFEVRIVFGQSCVEKIKNKKWKFLQSQIEVLRITFQQKVNCSKFLPKSYLCSQCNFEYWNSCEIR